MAVTRRQVLATTAWAVAAGAAPRNRDRSPQDASISRQDFNDWAWVRDQFDLSPQYLHFAQFFMVSHPRPVRDAIERLRRAMDRDPFLTVDQGLFSTDERNLPWQAQLAAADYIGGRPEDIALVDSTTEGLALVYNGLPLQPGDEVLTSTHDHYSHHESIRLAVQKSGANWRRIDLYASPSTVSVDEVAENLRRAIAPKTRVVGLTWVHSGTGVKLPVRQLAAVVSEANQNRSERDAILLIVDGVHGFGNQDDSPIDMGCDFFVAGTHKWIFGPRGTGIIWGRAEQWPRVRPTIPSFFFNLPTVGREQRSEPAHAHLVSPGGFKAYEHQWAMPEAFSFHQSIGRKRVADRTTQLSTQCKEGLAKMSHVKLHTPLAPELSAGINCFEIAGMTTTTAVRKLFERSVIASAAPYRVSFARLAPSLVNDEEQVDRALRAVHELQ